MKKYLLAMVLLNFALLQSCKKEDPIPPKVTPTLTISEILDSDVTYTSFVVTVPLIQKKKPLLNVVWFTALILTPK